MYCGQEIVVAVWRSHAQCHDEFDRRFNAGLCTFCGEKPRQHVNCACDGCFGNEKHQGYPGP